MNSKKYLKLTSDFYTRPEIIMLSNENKDFVPIYLRMLTMAIDTDGKLLFKPNIPYDIAMLAMLFGCSYSVMQSASKSFMFVGLLFENDDAYYLPKLKDMLIVEDDEEE